MTSAPKNTVQLHLAHLSQLDHLRPPPGWKTERAILSTYSAHTSVLAAMLLALSGEEDEVGSGSRVGFARAITELRGKVHFVLQSGRLTLPKNPSSIVALLDRFILQVPWDEGSMEAYKGQSWHAKFALVRHVPVLKELPGERWVFMLGSRNLTLDMSWDIGLVLKTDDEDARGQKTIPQPIDGIQKLTTKLIQLFPRELKDWSLLKKSLANAKWRVPAGMVIDAIHLDFPDAPGRGYPKPLPNLNRVLAISPFLDGTTVATIAAWGDGDVIHQLISTRMAFEKVAIQANNKLNQFDVLLALSPPEHEVILGSSSAAEEEQVAADQIGLHAKILFAEHAAGCTMWMGSPNLTSRAWTRNAECYAQVSIPKPIKDAGKLLLEGLEAFIDLGKPVSSDELGGLSAEACTQQRLSEARTQVSARLIKAVQSLGNNGSILIKCTGTPHPDESDIKLSCAPLTGQLTLWPLGSCQLEIKNASQSVSASDCMRFCLMLNGSEVEWVQVIPWNPALTEDRDTAVLSDYLGPRQMLSWIHEVLNGYSDGDEGGVWDDPPNKVKKSSNITTKVLGLPSIDQALRMWIKDKTQLDEVDRILKICDQRLKVTSRYASPEDKMVEIHLRKFSRSWKALRNGLKGGQHEYLSQTISKGDHRCCLSFIDSKKWNTQVLGGR